MGLLVAAFILAGGVSTLKDIMGPLLGQVPVKSWWMRLSAVCWQNR